MVTMVTLVVVGTLMVTVLVVTLTKRRHTWQSCLPFCLRREEGASFPSHKGWHT